MSIPLMLLSNASRLRRKYLLPVPGKLLVRKGQTIQPGDSLAEASVEPHHYSLDIARSLGIPPNQVESYLQCQVGSSIARQDLLAGPVGYAQKVVRSPFTGKVVQISEGRLVLQIAERPFELLADLPGEVVELIEARGVVLELIAALLQGTWGNGRTVYAKLSEVSGLPDDEIRLDPGDTQLSGSILAGGHMRLAETLQQAKTLGVSGLILASLDSSLAAIADQMPFPILVLEGFGRYPLEPQTLQLLTALAGKQVRLDARRWDRLHASRPEVIIPLEDAQAPELNTELGVIQPGQKIRLIGAGYHGARGVLLDLPGVSTFSTGIQSLGARVVLASGEELLVPFANLEFLG